MSGLKFCANLSFMYQETSSLLERYSLAKSAGFKGVECASPYEHSLEEVIKIKENLGLQQILINVPTGDVKAGELGFASLPGKENLFMESLNKAIDYAKGLKCQLIHITAGIVNSPDKTNREVYEKNLSNAAKILEKNDIVGVIEPINNYAVPNYYLNNYDLAMDVIKKINSPKLKLLLDIFHLQTIRGNLTRTITELHPYIGHIQIAQVPDRNEPNTPGEINHRYLFDHLIQVKYNGWIGLEYKPLTKTNDGLKWIEEFGFKL